MKYIVIYGWYDKNNVTNFKQCIGIEDDLYTAIGAGVMVLSQQIKKKKDENMISYKEYKEYKIEGPYELEGETGYGFKVTIDEDTTDFINVLEYDEDNNYNI